MKQKHSKFNLDGVKATKVSGIMSDPKLLRSEKKRIAEATKKSFDAYDSARRKSLELATKRYLD
jgi:hypothetical protein